ncbi:hypothetical protein [Nocardia seriolae]|uniref:Uncharacterized protein n=1 Tax=Nocardia seriolae TaxID=37332 RepID=A0A0B8N920_9NOCA|nr:hypothetical protein [Nocardia seriolae]APA96110.1 hypothetical protein NS506_02043 [Nocardia seriolae]MTJ65810.1 hypothetical protein [Nocardia seriolae]MTJ73931.1 hypothetical protein [Nocardia seriolae]MTJ86257.1 hypothetical protein [Nocardia seriolae]MTK30252.1 hypothetical protein [Nocardia seriolae]
MKQYSVFGLGVTLIMASGLFAAPPALAQEFAPGVNCVARMCTNETDDPYLVLWQVTCLKTSPSPGETTGIATTVTDQFSETVPAHATLSVDTDCKQGVTLSYFITGVQVA